MSVILNRHSALEEYQLLGGGKAFNLKRMLDAQIPVPEFIVVSDAFFRAYKKEINFLSQLGALSSPKDDAIRVEKIFRDHPMSSTLVEELKKQIDDHGLEGEEVAVRSSGLDEDSKEHSFAGMFSSFLHQKTISQIEESIRKCWASAYSERCLEYRLKINYQPLTLEWVSSFKKWPINRFWGYVYENPIDQINHESVIIEASRTM